MYIHSKMAQDLVVKFVTVRACELVKRISTVNDTTGICFKYHGEEDSKQIISVNIVECFFHYEKASCTKTDQIPSSTITQTLQVKFRPMSKLRPNLPVNK